MSLPHIMYMHLGLMLDYLFNWSVKYIPSWFPGATFKRNAKKWRADLDRAVDRPIKLVEKDLVCVHRQRHSTLMILTRSFYLLRSAREGHT